MQAQCTDQVTPMIEPGAFSDAKPNKETETAWIIYSRLEPFEWNTVFQFEGILKYVQYQSRFGHRLVIPWVFTRHHTMNKHILNMY